MPLKVTLILEAPEEFLPFLAALSADSGKDLADVLRFSLGLMRVALDARKEGNRVAVLTADDEVDQEIEGI